MTSVYISRTLVSMNVKKSFRVLIVDDDQDILDLISYNLEKEGFRVRTTTNSEEAISLAEDFLPDLIILDIMMPHPNGIELCKTLRSIPLFQNTVVFFLTAKSEHYYHEAALDTGGDDYLEKIIGLRALTYKVASVLKRNFVIRKRIPVLRVGNMVINRKTSTVSIPGSKEVRLSKPEFELLFFFAQNPSKTISLKNVLQNIWGSEIYLVDSSIEVYIQNLRNKLGQDVIQRCGVNCYRLFQC